MYQFGARPMRWWVRPIALQDLGKLAFQGLEKFRQEVSNLGGQASEGQTFLGGLTEIHIFSRQFDAVGDWHRTVREVI